MIDVLGLMVTHRQQPEHMSRLAAVIAAAEAAHMLHSTYVTLSSSLSCATHMSPSAAAIAQKAKQSWAGLGSLWVTALSNFTGPRALVSHK